MDSPKEKVEDKINQINEKLLESSLTKEQALYYLGHVFKESLAPENLAKVDEIVSEYLKNVNGGDFRYASGFFGRLLL